MIRSFQKQFNAKMYCLKDIWIITVKNISKSNVSRQLYTYIPKKYVKKKRSIFGAGLLAGLFVKGADHDRVSIRYTSR